MARLSLVRHGSDTTRADLGPLDEQYIYDGFRQLKTFRDRRGTSWQVAYTPLGDVSAVKQSNSPYGSTNPPRAEWEIRTAYNDLRVPRARNLHGLIEESYDYDEALNPVRVRRTGGGETVRTFDVNGRVVWQRDPAGTEVVSAYDPFTRIGYTTTLRVGDNGERLTTSARTERDVGMDVIFSEIIGHNDERRLTQTDRDDLGRVLAVEVREPGAGEYLFTGFAAKSCRPPLEVAVT